MSLAPSVTQAASSCSEHELVAAVRRGDDRAFEELYSRYRRRIAAYILGMVGDHARAEDITQDVFIAALRRMRDSERPIAFKPWIYEIAKNACIDEFRRTRRAQEVPLESDDDADGAPAHRGLLSRAPTPDVAMESRQQLSDLRGAFRGLSESHHKVLVLREFEGLSYTEIGERMGMTRPVVESTLFRARRRLSEEYEELVSGRRCEQVQTVIASPRTHRRRALGVREQRLLARHLAHCQACRRHAHLAGFDDSALQPTGVIGKIAALLPLPVGLWRWRRGGGKAAMPARASHSFDPISSVQALATYAGPSSPLSGLGRAAAAAATLAIAGAGGGIVATVSSQSSSGKSTSAVPRAAAVAAAEGSDQSGAGGSAIGSRGPTASTAAGRVGSGASSGATAASTATAAGRPSITPGDGTTTGSGAPLRSGRDGGQSNSTANGPSEASAADGSDSSSPTSAGLTIGASGPPSVNVPPASHLPGVPRPGTLPTVATPQLPSELPNPTAVLGGVLGPLTQWGGSQAGQSSGAVSSSSSDSGSGSASGGSGSGGSGSGGSGSRGSGSGGSGSGSGSAGSSAGASGSTSSGTGVGSAVPSVIAPVVGTIKGG